MWVGGAVCGAVSVGAWQAVSVRVVVGVPRVWCLGCSAPLRHLALVGGPLPCVVCRGARWAHPSVLLAIPPAHSLLVLLGVPLPGPGTV